MIRVLSLTTAERTLLKGFVGGVTDLAFAHLDSTQLACMDEAGNLFVWQLTSRDGKILYPPLPPLPPYPGPEPWSASFSRVRTSAELAFLPLDRIDG